ncbi:tRNA pseudouridine synthase B [Aerococcus urinaehominis]|uniref:tRNA pseudouridine synthase B n=1 Tax=Aerococcus urinaehominis TaxID=128944 RepID=A0A0X8FMJ9_9LACT|nr:tRNA pseudouridine(55) synthase TruB [Aerococcus urinaehominis]AMC00026.1 tRNA pseudouridine synthase B [Aerococcus urinaehominis]
MNGIIPLWKPRGMTSHDCVFKLRKILKTKKIGHTGTLDPNVDGVLPICVGQATKMVEFFMDKTKIYQGQITLGFATDTEDMDGQIVEESFIKQAISDSEIDQALARFKGEISQIPPMYSAVKVNGKRLYEYARQGLSVDRPERQVRIDYFKRLSDSVYDAKKGQQTFNFEVQCGRGTYVRTLAYDLGRELGVPATMTQLTRVACLPFKSAQCLTLDQVADLTGQGDHSFLLPLETAVSHLDKYQAPNHLEKLIINGAVLDRQDFPQELKFPCRIYIDQHLKAIYQDHPSKSGKIKPMKMF